MPTPHVLVTECVIHTLIINHTVFQFRLAEVEVLAGAGRTFLCSQWESQAVDLLPQGVERAEDLLHTFITGQELRASGVGGFSVSLKQHLTGVDGTLGFLYFLNGYRLDDITRGTLKIKSGL